MIKYQGGEWIRQCPKLRDGNNSQLSSSTSHTSFSVYNNQEDKDSKSQERESDSHPTGLFRRQTHTLRICQFRIAASPRCIRRSDHAILVIPHLDRNGGEILLSEVEGAPVVGVEAAGSFRL